MPLIERIWPWEGQPQEAVDIQREHPLAQGLFTGFANPALGPIRLSRTPSTFALPLIGSAQGVALSSASNTGLAVWDGNHSPERTELTVLVRAVRYGAQPDSGFGMVFTLVQVSGTQDPFHLFMRDAGDRIRINTTTSDNTDHSENSTTWPVDTWQTRVYRWRSGEAPSHWVDGASVAATTTYAGGVQSGTLKPAASMRVNLATLRLNGAISTALVWGRALSDNEIAEVSRDPWQLFAPRRILMPTVAASTLPTLSAATFVPGSLTSSGFRPRVTATWS